MSKYRNIKTEIDGITFASKREAKYYTDLKLMERAGEIKDLEVHPRFPLVINGKPVGRYTADFAFREKGGRYRVWDVKSVVTAKTDAFNLRKRLVEALYPNIVVEVIF